MSEFLAEASVLIRPNTTKFRALLEAEITAIVETAAVPPVVVPVVTTAGAAATGVAENTAILSAQTEVLAANTAAKERNAGADIERTLGSREAATATELQAQAEGVLSAITAGAELRAGELSKARFVLAETTRAGGIAEKAFALALEEGDAAIKASTADLVAHIEALNLDARAAVKDAIATTGGAKAHEQATRAITAQAASLAGIRGAVLTSSRPFLLATVAAVTFAKAIKEATSEQEALARVTKILGPAIGDVLAKDAQTLANSFGLSAIQALQFEGSLAEVFHNLGLGKQQTALFSEQVVKLAADMAAFNNTSPDVTLKALQLGISGNLRSLRPYIGALRQADVTNEALAESGKKSVKSLTSQELALARLTLIFRATANQQGAAAARAGELAQQSRILSANLSDLGASLGKLLIPGLSQEVQGLNVVLTQVGVTASDVGKDFGFLSDKLFNLVGAQKQASSDFKSGFLGTLATGLGLGVFGQVARIYEHLTSSQNVATLSAAELAAQLTVVGNEARKVAGPAGVVALSQKLTTLIGLLNQGGPKGREFAQVLTDLLTKLQLSGKIPVNLGLVFQEAQARAEVVKWWGVARDSIERGIDLSVAQKPVEARIPVKVSLDLKVEAAKAAGPTAELAQAQVNQAEALRNLRALLGLSPTAGRAEIQAAIDSRKLSKSRQAAVSSAFAELSAADAVIASAAADRVSAAKSAADKIKAARDAADKLITDAITARTTALDQRAATASGTARTLDDLNAALAQRATARILLRTLVGQIKDADTRRSVTAQLVSAEIAADNEVKKLREERKQAAITARQDVIDARQAHLEALLSIADTTKRTSDDKKALEALIKFDVAQIDRLKKIRKRTREQNAQLDAYRVDLAQREQALRELKKQNDKNKNAAKELAFSFLQTQAGFAANLLGNLIPGFATGGLVGGQSGTAAPTAGFTPPRQVSGGFEQPRGATGLAAQSALVQSRDRGVRPVQVDTTNHLLRQILRVLTTGRLTPPEARYQNRVAGSNMDTIGGV